MKNVASLVLCLAASAACTMPPYSGMVHPPEFGPQQPAWQTGGRYRTEGTQGGPPQAEYQNQGAPPRHSATTGVAATASERPIYGWDGGVVDGPAQGRVVREEPIRGIEPSATGRMHIIELYQEVLDERDALSEDVETLTAALEQAQAALAQKRQEMEGLKGRMAELEAGQERLFTQNQEIAARLTTAQIRRLEAEKLLLQSRIEGYAVIRGTAGAIGDRE